MEDNFDFDKVGKRLPYKVPADFFDTVTEDTLAEAERREGTKKKTKWFSWPAMAVAASLALLLALGCLWYFGRTEQTNIAVLENKAGHKAPAAVTAQPGTTSNTVADQEPGPSKEVEKVQAPAAKTSVEKLQPVHSQPAQPDQTYKAESLDELLASISDAELAQLAAVAETDLNVYEQTFERNEQAD